MWPGRLKVAASDALRERHPHGIRKALAQRPGRGLDPEVQSRAPDGPAVLEPNCRKFLISSIDSGYPVRCSTEYSSMEAWPFDSTNRSRSHQSGCRD